MTTRVIQWAQRARSAGCSYPRSSTAPGTLEGTSVGALIMLGTLLGLIILIFALVLRYDPEARGHSKSEGPDHV